MRCWTLFIDKIDAIKREIEIFINAHMKSAKDIYYMLILYSFAGSRTVVHTAAITNMHLNVFVHLTQNSARRPIIDF